MAQGKTNAMRILDSKRIKYELRTYDSNDGKIDGISVAQKISSDAGAVFKTLVTRGHSQQIYVFIIPSEDELDLKKAAKTAGEKKIEMVAVKDIQRLTGYIRGGCSPVGMKKLYPSFIDVKAKSKKRIVVSGGKIGIQIELDIKDLAQVIQANLEDICKN